MRSEALDCAPSRQIRGYVGSLGSFGSALEEHVLQEMRQAARIFGLVFRTHFRHDQYVTAGLSGIGTVMTRRPLGRTVLLNFMRQMYHGQRVNYNYFEENRSTPLRHSPASRYPIAHSDAGALSRVSNNSNAIRRAYLVLRR